MPTMNKKDIAIKTGISEPDLDSIALLHKAITPDPEAGIVPELSLTEKNNIETFLLKSIGDMALNKKLLLLEALKPQDTKIGLRTIELLKSFTFKSRRWPDTRPQMETLYENFNAAFRENITLAEPGKMTLSQYGALADLSSVANIFKNFNLGDLKNPDLIELEQASIQAKEIVDALKDNFSTAFKMPEVGTLLFKDPVAKADLHGKTLGIFDKIVSGPGTHAAIGIPTDTGPIISHTDAEYRRDSFGLSEFLYNDIYRIKLDALIAPEVQTYLRENLGEHWLRDIEKEYGSIQRELHDAKRRGNIDILMSRYSAEMRDKYGNMRYLLMGLSPFSAQHINPLMRDHTDVSIRDRMFARTNFQREDTDNIRIICSEFVGYCTIATIKELNDRTIAALKEKGCNEIPSTLIETPISENEVLFLLSPRRLLDVLQERGALERVVAPKNIANVVATKGQKPPYDYAIIQAAVNSPETLKQIIKTLPEDTFIDAVNAKNSAGDRLLHLAASNPESLRIILEAIPEDMREAALTATNDADETVFSKIAPHIESITAIKGLIPASLTSSPYKLRLQQESSQANEDEDNEQFFDCI